MEHPFSGQGRLYLLLLAFLVGFFAGWGAGPASAAVSGALSVASLAVAALRAGEIPLACAVAALCGAMTADRMQPVDPSRIRPFLDNEAILDGRVEEVRVTDSGWTATARECGVSSPFGGDPVSLGNVLLYLRNPDAPVSFPARIRAVGRLRPIRGKGNPGEIPREWSALAQGAQFSFSADAGKAIFLPEESGGWLPRDLFPRARRKTGDWVKRAAGTSDGAMYLRSLATGEVPPYSHPMVVLLRRTGLAHLLAISGLNVAIFHICTVFLLRVAIWSIRRRHGTPDLNFWPSVLSLPVSWGYVLLAGSPTPAVRSAGMITIATFAWQGLGVRAAGFAWSAMLLLTLFRSPFEMFSPSFLLSYGATFFLIANCRFRPDGPENGRWRRVRVWAERSILSCSVAFLGTLPISAAFNPSVPSLAVLWNVLFCPVLGTAGVAGAAVAVFGGVFDADALSGPVRIAARLLTVSLSLLDRASGGGAACFPVPPSGVAAPVLTMAAGIAGTIVRLRRGRSPWPAAVSCAAAFLVWIHLPYLALPQRDLAVTALNVGKGASHLVSFPGGGHMLIDCGSALRGDAGTRTVLPHLRWRGIRTIDVLALTHPHEDHFGGAAALLAAIPVREIWIPDGVPRQAFGPAVASWKGPVRAVRAGWKENRAGAEIVIRAPTARAPSSAVNENGMILELRYGVLSVWFPGDAEGGPSQWGEASPHPGERRVLFLPHHGSSGADPRGWIGFCRPEAWVAQNSRCLQGENLLPFAQRFLLENGAFTVRSDGRGLSFLQGDSESTWERLLWKG